MQYGTTFDSARDEHNFGGLLRLEQNLTEDTMILAALSRAVRTADTTERAMARNNWVGNFDITPEKHHQLDLGAQVDTAMWYINANVDADWVQDFILRDEFSVPGVTTYRNIDAELAGVELGAG